MIEGIQRKIANLTREQLIKELQQPLSLEYTPEEKIYRDALFGEALARLVGITWRIRVNEGG